MNVSTVSKFKTRALILSVLAAVAIYLALSLSTEWQEVLHAYQTIGWSGIGIALLLSLANYGLRFVRWQCYLTALGHRIPPFRSALIYLSGFALTTTPGKAGEMLRGVFLKADGVTYTKSTAAFLSERLSDLFAIVLLCTLGVVLYDQGISLIWLSAGLILSVQVVLSSYRLLNWTQHWFSVRQGKWAVFGGHFISVLLAARNCHALWLQMFALLLSLIAWTAEAYAFYLILHWAGLETSYSFAFSVYALSMLAGALSFLPGGLGSAEAVMIGLLLWGGMAEPQAIAATVVIRLVTLWFAVVLGCLALISSGKALKSTQGRNHVKAQV